MIIEDEFEKIGQFPREALNFGRSPQKAFITVPKAIFELPPKEKKQSSQGSRNRLEGRQSERR